MEPINSTPSASAGSISPGRSEDVPRAVEYLIQLALRGILWTFAFGFAMGALAGFFSGWPVWVVIALAILSFLSAVAGWGVKTSRARIVVDHVGPAVVVPREESAPQGRTSP